MSFIRKSFRRQKSKISSTQDISNSPKLKQKIKSISGDFDFEIKKVTDEKVNILNFFFNLKKDNSCR